MQTTLCKCLGIELPIIQAPMGGAVGLDLGRGARDLCFAVPRGRRAWGWIIGRPVDGHPRIAQ